MLNQTIYIYNLEIYIYIYIYIYNDKSNNIDTQLRKYNARSNNGTIQSRNT